MKLCESWKNLNQSFVRVGGFQDFAPATEPMGSEQKDHLQHAPPPDLHDDILKKKLYSSSVKKEVFHHMTPNRLCLIKYLQASFEEVMN